jgi:hypothetical protein
MMSVNDGNAPLPAAVKVAPVVAVTGEVQPLRVAKLIALMKETKCVFGVHQASGEICMASAAASGLK